MQWMERRGPSHHRLVTNHRNLFFANTPRGKYKQLQISQTPLHFNLSLVCEFTFYFKEITFEKFNTQNKNQINNSFLPKH